MGLTEEYTWGLEKNACGAYGGIHVRLTEEYTWGLAYLWYMWREMHVRLTCGTCGGECLWNLSVVSVEGNAPGAYLGYLWREMHVGAYLWYAWRKMHVGLTCGARGGKCTWGLPVVPMEGHARRGLPVVPVEGNVLPERRG